MRKANRGIVVRAVLILMMTISTLWKINAQAIHVTADPALGSMGFYDLSMNEADANLLKQNSYYYLRLRIRNLDLSTPIPAGTAMVVVNLGSYLILDPSFDLATEAPLTENFTWNLDQLSGADQVYGVIHTALPPDYNGFLLLRVKAIVQNTSTASSNFVISNNSPAHVLSDANPGNNGVYAEYSIVAIPLPVTITKFTAMNSNCSIQLNWTSENEQNLSRYEVEASKDGVQYSKVAAVPASGSSHYTSSFAITDQLKANSLMVRLKTVDTDGSFKYSKVVNVSGYCGLAAQSLYYAYPNPLTSWENLTVATRQGAFKGKYQLRLVDQAGRLCNVKTVELNNVTSFRPAMNDTRAAGKYLLEIRKTDGTESGVINIERL